MPYPIMTMIALSAMDVNTCTSLSNGNRAVEIPTNHVSVAANETVQSSDGQTIMIIEQRMDESHSQQESVTLAAITPDQVSKLYYHWLIYVHLQ